MTKQNISDRLSWQSNLEELAGALKQPFVIEATDMPKLFTIAYHNDIAKLNQTGYHGIDTLPLGVIFAKIRDSIPAVEDNTELIKKLHEMSTMQFGEYNEDRFYKIIEELRVTPKDYWKIYNHSKQAFQEVYNATEGCYNHSREYKPEILTEKEWASSVLQRGIHSFRNNYYELHGRFLEEKYRKVK